ncbi:MAG: RAD55 family ATPase [Candidatus Micrarchaeota archaeon]
MKIGIAKLDGLLKGGFREPSNVLLIGPPGVEKLVFGMQFVNQGLAEKQPCIYITTDKTPLEIENQSGEYGMRLFSHTNRGLRFVDCYSWTLEKPPQRRSDILVPGPSSLNDLSIGITQAMQEAFKPEAKVRGVLQSVSTLLLYNNPEVVCRFLQVIGARLKAANSTTVFLLDEGMHDEKVIATMKHLMDEVVEIKSEGERFTLRVPTSGLEKWVGFKLGKTGIEFP